MVTKKTSTGEKEARKGRVKVGKLQLNKETVKDLSGSEEKQIKGGILSTGGGCTWDGLPNRTGAIKGGRDTVTC